jgi:hypothetical protein
MAAAVVSYLGAFTAPYRDRMVSAWSTQLTEARHDYGLRSFLH